MAALTEEPTGNDYEEGEMVKGKGNREKRQNLTSTITLDSESTSVNIDEKKQALAQPAGHMPEKSAELKEQPSSTQEQPEVPKVSILKQTDIQEHASDPPVVPVAVTAGTKKKGDDLTLPKVFEDSTERKDNPAPLKVPAGNSENEQADQPTEQIPLQTELKSEGDSPPLSQKSSASGGSDSSSSFIKVSTGNGGGTENSSGEHHQTPSDSSGDFLSFEKIDEGLVVTTGNDGNGQLDNRSEASDVTDKGEPSLDTADDECSEVFSIVSEGPLIKDVTGDEEPLLGTVERNSTLEGSSNPQDTRPKKPAPAPTPPVVSNEQVDSVPTTSNPGKNKHAPQNAKSSELSVITASALAIAGVALGVAIAVHLKMLEVGIAVGVCCLVAAVIYCCIPRSSVEESKVEGVNMREGLTTASV
ncbi:hypothetical protein [Wolbachia endosymbiont of Cantharis cryptica]|uniref:TomO hydrophobic C-terminal domain-containing protein n=1 Tax=Wolbachia endosymbiont of Cantharis cryptica TaxID=3066132 RepID=UPI00376EB05C